MKLTDAEVKALYVQCFGEAEGDWQDEIWAKGCTRVVRDALNASSFEKAVEILDRDGWGDPRGCATKLLRMEPCAHCAGTGFVRKS